MHQDEVLIPGPIIFLACFPKSGSTYISNLLSLVTGIPLSTAVYYYGHNEQDIFEPALTAKTTSIIQQHAKGTGYNVYLLKKHGIRPLILVRNIYDAILSLRDHIQQESPVFPSVYVHRRYFEMNADEQLMFLLRGAVPWYLNFLMSWHDSQTEIEMFWLSYEEFFTDQVKALEKILLFYQLDFSQHQVDFVLSQIDPKKFRFNVGKSGRGSQLSRQHLHAVEELARTWKLDAQIARQIGIDLN